MGNKIQCLSCLKQFVEDPQNRIIPTETKERIRRSLVERVPLEGICRIFDISMSWLLDFMEQTFQALPENLNATVIAENIEFEVFVLEADEQWSFVGNKKNDQWLWLVMHSKTKQILAFHIGKRNKASGETLMAKLPEDLKKKPTFTQINSQLTMKLSPLKQHTPLGKESGKTSYIQRFNCTIRPRCARLVRKTLSFSKKIENHIGLIKMFICHYNDNLKSLPL
jgi:insertion element IS1 protein InsB